MDLKLTDFDLEIKDGDFGLDSGKGEDKQCLEMALFSSPSDFFFFPPLGAKVKSLILSNLDDEAVSATRRSVKLNLNLLKIKAETRIKTIDNETKFEIIL